MTLLNVEKVVKTFGGLRALDHVNFSIEEGQVTGMIGPNGSGKSTLFNVISGVLKPDSGHVYFRSERIDSLEPHKVYEKGLVRGFQTPRLFFGMWVLENVMVPPRHQIGEGLLSAPIRSRWSSQEKELAKKALGILRMLDLAHMAHSPSPFLSGGQQKLCQLGLNLMTDPKLVLLDEPLAGLLPDLARKIMAHIKALKDQQKIDFLIIEHRLELLFDIVSNVFVLDKGKVIAEGNPKEVVNDSQVIKAYMGG